MERGGKKQAATIAPVRPGLQARIRIVQSPANRWAKALRAALRRPPVLADGGLLALEGAHLVTEALRSGLAPSAVFLRQGEELEALDVLGDLPADTELLALPPSLFAATVETEAPQPVAALLPAPARPFPAAPGPALVLVLAALQDPGNVGTLLRSAEAFGATAAVLLAGTATPWSGKALRASAGSALRLPLVPARDAREAAGLLRARGIRSYAAVPSDGISPGALPLGEACALWIGNEGAGLRLSELEACEGRVSLPMPGATESLNAAVAGSILLYEAARHRSQNPRTGKPR